MACQKCDSVRVAHISAKCSDCFGMVCGDRDHEGYVTRDIGIGGGDYVEFAYCMECGQIQGKFPVKVF